MLLNTLNFNSLSSSAGFVMNIIPDNHVVFASCVGPADCEYKTGIECFSQQLTDLFAFSSSRQVCSATSPLEQPSWIRMITLKMKNKYSHRILRSKVIMLKIDWSTALPRFGHSRAVVLHQPVVHNCDA